MIVKMLMPPKTAERSLEVCRAVVCVLINSVDDERHHLHILRYLLQNFPPLKLESITFTGYGDIIINDKTIDTSELEYSSRQICSLFIEMVCHFLQETCLCTNLSIEYDDSETFNEDTIGDQLTTLSDNLTRHPPSLFKLSALTVKQNMKSYEDSDFDALEVPVHVVSKLKWQEVATDLYDMWYSFRIKLDECRFDEDL